MIYKYSFIQPTRYSAVYDEIAVCAFDVEEKMYNGINYLLNKETGDLKSWPVRHEPFLDGFCYTRIDKEEFDMIFSTTGTEETYELLKEMGIV